MKLEEGGTACVDFLELRGRVVDEVFMVELVDAVLKLKLRNPKEASIGGFLLPTLEIGLALRDAHHHLLALLCLVRMAFSLASVGSLIEDKGVKG